MKTEVKPNVSKHLDFCLKKIKERVQPNQEFEYDQLTGLGFERCRWVCEKLEEAGILTSRLELKKPGNYSYGFNTYYKLT